MMLGLSALLVMALTCSGCNNAAEGALSGGAVGALSGAAIGSLSGNAGAGAAIGAVVGGVGGAIVGDQNRRRSEEMAAMQQAPPPPQMATPQVVSSDKTVKTTTVTKTTVTSQYPPTPTSTALGRFVGEWRVTGSIDAGDGRTIPIGGTASGNVDKTFFVRLDLQFIDPRTGEPVIGTSTISQHGGRKLEMINAFSTSPTIKRFDGEADASETTFTFKQVDPPASSRRVIFKTSYPGFTAEVWDGGRRVESYTFSPS
ncbi:MAG TPA: YMGG-like glycine zipper-containing protein [Tepidisphaeraceae bacterium]|jgi:hypothetical protein